MLVTDLSKEFQYLLYREHVGRADICRIFEITPGNLSRLLHKPMPTPQLVTILEVLGYDIKIEFVKRGETKDE